MRSPADSKIGILGGGQLGRMLIQSAVDLDVHISVLDPDPDAPCAGLATAFTVGSLTDYDTVYRWGQDQDLLTIEIEHVNVEALAQLAHEGKRVFPQPEVIRIIQDKRQQKHFYRAQGIPTAAFVLIDGPDELRRHTDFLPAFQKLGRGGYDGRGVVRLRSADDLSQALEGPSLLERLVDIDKELAVLIARNPRGEIAVFPTVEMVFHPQQHLVDYLVSPAAVSDTIHARARALATQVITALDMVGVLAVEMFLTRQGELLVNEVAPRPHNSGHQTIEGNRTSQYAQHLRAILDLPLGDTSPVMLSAMVNILGGAGAHGPARVAGLEQVLAQPGMYVHLYGKKVTRPFRKMGHVTILAADRASLQHQAAWVKDTLRVMA